MPAATSNMLVVVQLRDSFALLLDVHMYVSSILYSLIDTYYCKWLLKDLVFCLLVFHPV